MELLVDIEKDLPGFTLKVKFKAENETLGLLGASGCGKSITLRCIAGIETPTRGSIILNDKILFDSKKGINLPARKRKVGFLFQNYALFPHMTVAQNISAGLINLPQKERCRIVEEKIEMMHLKGLEERYPCQLSGGQQQRVALARALAIEPELLLLDEPFSALDNYLKGQVEKELIDVLTSFSGVALFVSHDMDEVYRICKNIIVLSKGREEAYGPKDEIFKRPPSLAAAQLTGCKNISRARKISSNTVEALDWGCTLQVNEPVNDSISYIGIRAHHIILGDIVNNKNVFNCTIQNVSETRFSVSAYIQVNNTPLKNNSHYLQWEVSKDLWSMIHNSFSPLNVCIPPEKIFLI